MRLVVWNCRFGMMPRQAAALAELRPDVAVIPEAEQSIDWPLDAGPAPSGVLWAGSHPSKGLGVLSFGDWTISLHDPAPRLPWAFALDVTGPATFLLIAVWTVLGTGDPRYSTQVARIIEEFRPELSNRCTVLAGDLNCSGNTSDPGPHLRNVKALGDLGLESAFHTFHSVEPGDEPMGTLYWRWQRSAPFHCDMAFVPSAWARHIRSVEVGDFGSWVGAGISDHAPVIIDLDLQHDLLAPEAAGSHLR